ncbi:Mu transposase C-terminal domain-containing protein [uncultured Desulfuromonas sp.]|uniref:Mu transposase C-terminal domain-containing protein n=1 Tax=uncultured Desulfuromonas sp. TaxID=181013 RepID=UPI002AABFD55|nr:Mu transposase C-terminal domain-containing protein [uncultured Desulfuromonas sp.]
MKDWFTAKELADRAIDSLPKTESGMKRRADRDGWDSRKRSGSKALEYHISSLPDAVQSALLDHAIATLPETSCALPQANDNLPAEYADLPAPAQLAGWQRSTMDARYAILNLVNTIAERRGLNKAIDHVLAQAKNDLLPEHIQALIPVANARSANGEGKNTLSRRTIYRWRDLAAIGGTALAPKPARKKEIQPWAKYFLKCYQRPQKPSVQDALDEMKLALPEGVAMPSQSQCYRLLNKMSAVDRNKGRMSAKELKSIKPFRRRDTSELLPLDVCQCDGHSFKAKVAHPVHGRPFKPECCAVIDAATRMVIGWSSGLAESAETVADALRHAISTSESKPCGGIMAITYADPGSGNLATVNAHPAFGRYARLGITFKTGITGNSQARGLVERLQKSLWIRAAKQLPTYMGRDMDSSIAHKIDLQLKKEIKNPGASGILPSWPQFRDLCAAAVEHYNNTPHSSLPKITDAGGNRRYMTPQECWNLHVAQGWKPETVDNDELADLFRPRTEVKCNRGEVRMFGNIYFSRDLMDYHQETVILEYEPQDGSFVMVRDMEERLICRAEFEANKSSMFPMDAVTAAREARAKGREKRLLQKLEEVRLERNGVIELEPSREQVAIAQKALETRKTKTRIPDSDRDRYRLWCQLDEQLATGGEIEEHLQKFYRSFQNTSIWKSFRKVESTLAINQ